MHAQQHTRLLEMGQSGSAKDAEKVQYHRRTMMKRIKTTASTVIRNSLRGQRQINDMEMPSEWRKKSQCSENRRR